jgi:outer membrane lipoprotein LolB
MPRVTTCLIAIVLHSIVAGCATAPTPDAVDWRQHRDQLSALEHWAFTGRIAVRTETGGDTASLRWQQAGDDFSMTLSGPMGLKETTLLREAGSLSLLRDGIRQPLQADDGLLRSEFGWTLPTDYLPWWLRGLPGPGPARQELAEGRLAWLEQAGWRIEFAEYRRVGDAALPRSIRFQREDVSGKILLKQWTLAP